MKDSNIPTRHTAPLTSEHIKMTLEEPHLWKLDNGIDPGYRFVKYHLHLCPVSARVSPEALLAGSMEGIVIKTSYL